MVLKSVVADEIGIHGSPEAHAARASVGAIGEALAAGWLTIANPGIESSDQPLNEGRGSFSSLRQAFSSGAISRPRDLRLRQMDCSGGAKER